jgi:hypothetical protein
MQIFWNDTQFHESMPDFAHFIKTQIGDEQGLESQTKVQRHPDFMNNSNDKEVFISTFRCTHFQPKIQWKLGILTLFF